MNYFLAARRFAQIAFNLAESLARAAGLILPLPFFVAGVTTDLTAGAVPLILAQRALAPAEILALAGLLMVNFFCFGPEPDAGVTVEPNNRPSSFSSD